MCMTGFLHNILGNEVLMIWGVSQSEEWSCSVVWWYSSRYLRICCQMAAGLQWRAGGLITRCRALLSWAVMNHEEPVFVMFPVRMLKDHLLACLGKGFSSCGNCVFLTSVVMCNDQVLSDGNSKEPVTVHLLLPSSSDVHRGVCLCRLLSKIRCVKTGWRAVAMS